MNEVEWSDRPPAQNNPRPDHVPRCFVHAVFCRPSEKQSTRMLQRILQPGQGFSLALLQQSSQHVLCRLKQVLSFRAPCSSSASECVEPQYRHLELHAAALQDIKQLLPAGTLERTFKGCKAGFAFSLEEGGLYIPLEVKAGRIQKDAFNGSFQARTRQSGGHPVPLLLCRPYPDRGQTLVITHSMVPQNMFSARFRKGTKYYPFFVRDDQLGPTVGGIYEAVRDGESHGMLPSGQVVDISQLELKPLDQLSKPHDPNGMKRREFYVLRKQWLPALDIHPPSKHYLPVDAVIEGVRLGDRLAAPAEQDRGYYVNLLKRCLKRERQPLHWGDLDALWVYHPDKVHFWLVPAHVLVQKGILATAQQPGKVAFLLYDHSYVKPQRGKGADLWTQQYLLDSRDPGLMENVMHLVKAAKSPS